MSNYSFSIGSDGISAPLFEDILSGLQNDFRAIYGSDIYIEADSQDGQWIASIAKAFNDANNSAIDCFNSFSPTFAQGAGLSSVVKINGIKRLVATYSTALGTVVGQVGTIINAGVVEDANGNKWALPTSVTIPVSGSISVTVTSVEPGAITASSGTINKISTPQKGWQSFASIADANAGQPVESDAALRQRQSSSTSIPSKTVLGSLLGSLLNLPGVSRAKVYENDTDITDPVTTLARHSISAVIAGGNITDIVTTIGQKKTPGASTFGDDSGTYSDPVTGISYVIKYNQLDLIPIKVKLFLTPKSGFNTNISTEIQQACSAFVNSLDIGAIVQYWAMGLPAQLNGAADKSTYEVTNIQIAKIGDAFGTIDIPIAYNQAASLAITDVTIVTP